MDTTRVTSPPPLSRPDPSSLVCLADLPADAPSPLRRFAPGACSLAKEVPPGPGGETNIPPNNTQQQAHACCPRSSMTMDITFFFPPARVWFHYEQFLLSFEHRPRIRRLISYLMIDRCAPR
jgi:hypothetical protein